jgi:hypothetical protein
MLTTLTVHEHLPRKWCRKHCPRGGVAEWPKATVLKTVARKRRGFESLLLLKPPAPMTEGLEICRDLK